MIKNAYTQKPLYDGSLEDAVKGRVNLSGANISYLEPTKEGIYGQDFSCAQIDTLWVCNTVVRDCTFYGAGINVAYFFNSLIQNCIFYGTEFRVWHAVRCVLRGLDLRGARGAMAFEGNDMAYIDLEEVEGRMIFLNNAMTNIKMGEETDGCTAFVGNTINEGNEIDNTINEGDEK